MGGEEPGGEDGTAAAPVEVFAAGVFDAAEEFVGEVETAGLGLGLNWECGNCGWVERLVWVTYRFGE